MRQPEQKKPGKRASPSLFERIAPQKADEVFSCKLSRLAMPNRRIRRNCPEKSAHVRQRPALSKGASRLTQCVAGHPNDTIMGVFTT